MTNKQTSSDGTNGDGAAEFNIEGSSSSAAPQDKAVRIYARWVRKILPFITLVVALVALAFSAVAVVGTADVLVQTDRVIQERTVPSVQIVDGLTDLFGGPVKLKELIDTVQASTVTIFCKDSQGSGWVVDLGLSNEVTNAEDVALDEQFPFEVITNHHVIKDCIDSPRQVEAQAGAEVFDAYLYSWDKKNDLALVAISQLVPPLEVSKRPQPGWWAMAVGTPYGLEGSVSVGNVMNTDGNEVISTTPLNSGNSGGPLVNAYGQVMGTNTYVMVGDDAQDWNVAMAVPALCRVLLDCVGDDTFTWD